MLTPEVLAYIREKRLWDPVRYAERLTELYGEPDVDSAGESTESGSSWEVWKTERGQIKLLQSYGLCTLEITAPSVGLG